jgi:hypothetical protein
MSNRVFANMPYPPDYYAFQPGDLTFPGDGGFWWDFGDWDNMYLDTAMTVKVTAAGQKVAAVRDKGVNGFHLVQATAGNRPTAVIQGGFKTLDFNKANFERLGCVRTGMALATCRNWVIAETDDTAIYHRFLSVSAASGGTADTVGPNALAVNSGDASNIYDVRGLQSGGGPTLQVRATGSGNTPFGVYEFLMQMSQPVKLILWRDNVQQQTDSTATGTLNAFSDGYPIVGCMSQGNDFSTTGPLDGRLWQILHLGTLPSAFDEGRVEAWFNKWRY